MGSSLGDLTVVNDLFPIPSKDWGLLLGCNLMVNFPELENRWMVSELGNKTKEWWK
jgi:hypothetical protein